MKKEEKRKMNKSNLLAYILSFICEEKKCEIIKKV